MIPRVIHRAWLGGEEPEWTRPFAETWLRPGWELREWNDREVEGLELRNRDLYERADAIAGRFAGQLRGDILRYEILHEHGGVWVDADFECIRPIDPLLEGVESFAAWEVPGRWINNAILGAVAGLELYDELIRRLRASVRDRPRSRPNKISGPQYLTPLVRRYGRTTTIFEREVFYPFGWEETHLHDPAELVPEAAFPAAYAVHWWRNRRRLKGISE